MFATPDLSIIFWITAFVADAAAVNPNGIKKPLANGVSAFFIKGKLFFGNGPESISRNQSSCIIFDNLMLAGKLANSNSNSKR